MKTFRFFFSLVCALAIIGVALISINCAGTTDASVSANIGDQPIWGPTGYDRADFYYIPDIDSYYSVSEHEYIYRDGTEWHHAASLPNTTAYSSYDQYHSYKVVVNQPKPYQDNENHKAKYTQYKGVKTQPVIRDSKETKYFVNKDHPEHDNWVKSHQQ
ncbi:MAG TPA: hypothetical protein VKS81_09505 [Bacteroidota bacterium]|nr:hypothetical protein [Bacteroidota bacterium]